MTMDVSKWKPLLIFSQSKMFRNHEYHFDGLCNIMIYDKVINKSLPQCRGSH